MEQVTRLLAVSSISDDSFDTAASNVPAGPRLPPLTLEASNSLLSPLGSHLRTNWTRER